MPRRIMKQTIDLGEGSAVRASLALVGRYMHGLRVVGFTFASKPMYFLASIHAVAGAGQKANAGGRMVIEPMSGNMAESE